MTVFSTVQAEIRCLDTTSSPPPSDWKTAAFDDSSWSLSAAPAMSGTDAGANLKMSPGVASFGHPSAGVERIWPTAAPTGVRQSAVFRWHVTLPGAYSLNTTDGLTVWEAAALGSFLNGYTITLLWINETNFPSSFWQSPSFGGVGAFAACTHAGDNIFAVSIDPSLTPLVDQWGVGYAWWAMQLTVDVTARGRSFGQVIG